MKIKQAWCGARFFKDAFQKKYGLRDYDNPHEPAIFFGLYPRQRKIIQNHKSLAVIIWTGSDALYFHTYPVIYHLIKDRPNTFHIAISNFIANDLDLFGLKYKSIPITPHTYEGYKPEPLGTGVYYYYAPTKPDLYGLEMFEKVKKLMPEQKFHKCHVLKHSKNELMDIYKDSFIGLRLTSHDGLSNTVIELGMMGRRCIWNGGSPNALAWLDYPQAIANTIKREKERQIGKEKHVANAVKEYMKQKDNWLKTEFWTNGSNGNN